MAGFIYLRYILDKTIQYNTTYFLRNISGRITVFQSVWGGVELEYLLVFSISVSFSVSLTWFCRFAKHISKFVVVTTVVLVVFGMQS